MNWDKIFSQAHLSSGPGWASLCIANRKPPHETGENLFARDHALILSAAAKHGYKQQASTPNPRAVSFVNLNLRGRRNLA